jgi:adenylate kinase
MIILILGPSGVGKSTTLKSAERHFPHVAFYSLDDLVADWAVREGIIATPDVRSLYLSLLDNEKFFDCGLTVLREFAEKGSEDHVVIDVGAGFQGSARARSLRNHFKTVAIVADPKMVYRRVRQARNDSRTFEKFQQSEFSVNRRAVYGSVHHVIDNTLQTQQQTLDQFVQLLNKLLQGVSPIILTAGISSVGKSTLIEKLVNGSRERTKVVMAHEIQKAGVFNPGNHRVIVHYNMLRSIQRSRNLSEDFSNEAVLKLLLEYKARLRAIVLVAPKGEIERRIRGRQWVEPVLRDHAGKVPYPRDKMLSILKSIDLTALYKRFFQILDHQGIPCAMVDSSGPRLRSLKSRAEVFDCINS